MAFESSASASSATPAFRAGQKLRRSSRACKPRGGPSTSRRITAWRTLARLRSNVLNGWRGVTREGAVARGIGTGADGRVIGGGGATVMDGATSTAAGSKEVVVGGGGPRSLGVVTRGGNGCTQLRFAFGLCSGGATGVTTRRGRTGGGGRVPGGAPSASRKRRIRSSSLCAGGRGGACSLGEGGSGFSASPGSVAREPLKDERERAEDEEDERVVHDPFIEDRESRITFLSTVSPWHQSIPASSCRPARFSFARNP